MKVTRCDICGRDVDESRAFYLGITGGLEPIRYMGRDGREHTSLAKDYDLCAVCVREAVEAIEKLVIEKAGRLDDGREETEGQDVQGAD